MLSVKENFLRTLSGETPEYVSTYSIQWGSGRPSVLAGERGSNRSRVGKDIYGVEWVNEGSALEGAIPKPGDYILTDIRKWRDVIRFPEFASIDWEAMSKADLARSNPDMPRGGGTSVGGFFQNIMAFMGFEEGLLACFEEPEEVRALLDFLCDGFLSIADNYLKYYKPDFIAFGDDIAHERNPFVSLEMFHDLFAPVWRRYLKFYKDRGYLATHHNCGRVEEFVDDMVDMGFNLWEAQSCNDLVGIKKRHGNKLVIAGGFDSRRFLSHIEATEEEIRGAVKKMMDDLAPGGGFVFGGGIGGDDPVSKQRNEWVQDEFAKLRYSYYS